MKPIIIIPPDTLSPEDIQQLRDNDLCVIVAKDPKDVRFLDPIPAAKDRSKMEQAAILMSRRLLNGFGSGSTFTKSSFANLFIEILIEGSPLDLNGTEEEQHERLFKREKEAEIVRLARIEAKAEREAKKKKLAEKSK